MSEKRRHVEIHSELGFTRVNFLDRELIDEWTVGETSEELTALVRANPGIRLLLDFGRVARVSSVTLGMLTTLLIRVMREQGQLRLTGLAPKVHQEFDITKLNLVFDIRETPEDAAAGFAQA